MRSKGSDWGEGGFFSFFVESKFGHSRAEWSGHYCSRWMKTLKAFSIESLDHKPLVTSLLAEVANPALR